MKRNLYKLAGVPDTTREHMMNICIEGAIQGHAESEREGLRIYGELLAEGTVPKSKYAHAYIVKACKRAALTDSPRADRLRALLSGVRNREPEALAEAVSLLSDQANIVPAQRDKQRQRGTRKPRRPEIDEWFDEQLDRRPGVKSPQLWAEAPDWITDQIEFDRFKKRLTEARKRRK